MSKRVTIEAIKVQEAEPMPHNTYTVKVNGKVHDSFNELSNDYALTQARELVTALVKKYERNHTIEVARGF